MNEVAIDPRLSMTEPIVVFELALEPSPGPDVQCTMHRYPIPRLADALTGLEVLARDPKRGAHAIQSVRVRIMGDTVYEVNGTDDGESLRVPLHLNLLKLGYHSAEVEVVGEDVEVIGSFKMIKDIEERRRMATSGPLFGVIV
jgi:hypothetical protein